MISAKRLILSVFLSVSFLRGTIDLFTVGVFLNVFGIGSTDGGIVQALLLKIGTSLKSHRNVVCNSRVKYFTSNCFEHILECFVGIQCWWFTKCTFLSFKDGLESGKPKTGRYCCISSFCFQLYNNGASVKTNFHF